MITPSEETGISACLDRPAQRALLALARSSIEAGATDRSQRHLDAEDWGALWQDAATFVTINDVDGNLRGCRGVIDPCRPLPLDVAENACASAYEDSRFRPVTAAEIPELSLAISILSPRTELAVTALEDLHGILEPGADGLLIEAGHRRATFLPKVWAQLPTAASFTDQLWHKAGLRPGDWPDGLRCWRYRATDFSEHDLAQPT